MSSFHSKGYIIAVSSRNSLNDGRISNCHARFGKLDRIIIKQSPDRRNRSWSGSTCWCDSPWADGISPLPKAQERLRG